MNTTNNIQNQTLRQTMLSFAYLAYTGEEITDSTQLPSMESNINTALPQIQFTDGSGNAVNLSNWSLAWGPVAYTVPGALYQDNMMYVVKNTTAGLNDQYVIAIRGTNFISELDWLLEDFEVINTLPWPILNGKSTCASGSLVSESTSIDMNILIGTNSMTDPDSGSLFDFLSSVTKKGGIQVCVTGHSLGGMLASTLALYMLENTSEWDVSGKSTVSCISFAAPTAGNDLYATNANGVFTSAFKSDGSNSFPGWDTSLGSNLDLVTCNLDVAPYFFNGTNLYTSNGPGTLFSIYSSPNNSTNNINFNNMAAGPEAEWSAFQTMILSKLAPLTSSQNYSQIPPASLSVNQPKPIPGTFIGNSLSIPYNIPNSDFIGLSPFLDSFLAQAAWQHSCSYPIYLGIPALFDPTIIVRKQTAPPAIAPPQITSVTPNASSSTVNTGVPVVISGSGFNASNPFANFIVFDGQSAGIPYFITSATENQLHVTFYLENCATGTQSFSVVGSSPNYISGSATFTVG